MADYTQVNDYSAKDALATGNPLKLIQGSDVDAEFSAIAAAIASKFDSTDIATAGEAQAGVSNTVVITPARLTAWAANGGGAVGDLQALADPGADRIIFWDDSEGEHTYLSLGANLSITGTVLSVNEGGLSVELEAGAGLTGGGVLNANRTLAVGAGTGITVNADDIAVNVGAVDHDSLLNYDSDEHIDHSAVTLTAGEGLTGGGTIEASRSFALDVDGLTEETGITPADDWVVFYDDSASAHRKIAADALIGAALGDGKWFKSTTTALTTTEQTIVFNSTDNDDLELGTFATGTGIYTAGSAGARILVSAGMVVPSLGEEAAVLRIQKEGTDQAYSSTRRNTLGDNTEVCVTVVNLAAGEEMRIRAGMESGSATADAGIAGMHVSIVELG